MPSADPSTPLVTIVTPSYNQGRFIGATIESVLSQDYPRVEYIVVDGGSTDDTAEVVAGYRDRLTWISEPDRGQAHAINKGFKMAKGEIVAWLNSDDLFLPGAISAAVAAMQSDPQLAMVYGDARVIDEHGSFMQEVVAWEHNSWALANQLFYIAQPTAFFRRWAFDQVGWLDESLYWSLDWDLEIRITSALPTRRIPRFMAAPRFYEETKSGSRQLPRFLEITKVMRRYSDSRYPPVYFVLALLLMGYSFARGIRRWAGRIHIDAGWLEARVLRATQSFIAPFLEPGGGLYSDGWARRRLHVDVQPTAGRVDVGGEVPGIYHRLRPQRLVLKWNGRVMDKVTLRPGSFRLSITLPPELDGPGHLEIRARRAFVPRRRGMNQDSRRLAYRLTSLA